MSHQKRFRDLSELRQLLPPTDGPVPQAGRTKPNSVEHDGKGKKVRVSLETVGRKGKAVTIVSGLQHNPSTMTEIARILKQHCGAGGTVKGMEIEIQGDQRNRVTEILRQMNYIVT
ncbi:MAG: translation initiation factor [Ignavibacteria bacterium]|nr:translation initiation factor [Ignavibacteria bacterium]